VPSGPLLVLNLLRWGNEVRDSQNLDLPATGTKSVAITEKELKMAEQLINDMSAAWNPDQYRDSFKDEIMKLVQQKVEKDDLHAVAQPEEHQASSGGAQILDLTELLQRSLKKGKGGEDHEKHSPKTPGKENGATTSTPAININKRRNK
jgi:DNA end-binding protein Ku